MKSTPMFLLNVTNLFSQIIFYLCRNCSSLVFFCRFMNDFFFLCVYFLSRLVGYSNLSDLLLSRFLQEGA